MARFPNEAVFEANKPNIKIFMRKGLRKNERLVLQVCDQFENQRVTTDHIKEMRKQKNVIEMRLNRIFNKIKVNLYGQPFEPVEM